MPVTVIGPAAADYPAICWPTVVYLKKSWEDDWQFVPWLRVTDAKCCISGQDLDSAVFVREYGSNKQTFESAFSTKPAWGDLAGWWVRVELLGPQGGQPIWIGKLSSEDRHAWGSQANGPAGQQRWPAYGPAQILRKISVSHSYWSVGGEEKYLGWIPPLNDVNQKGLLGVVIGNRAEAQIGGVYVYGGEEVWNHRQYVEYVLEKFCNTDPAGPTWSLAGQADVLEQFTDVVKMGTTQTVSEILSQLIPPERGVDYTIRATDSGFVVWVFALSPFDFCVGNFVMPKNPNQVQIQSSQTLDNTSTRVVSTVDHAYDHLRIQGSRAVVCFSLEGPDVLLSNDTLEGKWDTGLEALYLQGTGGAGHTPDMHDRARQNPLYRQVFSSFGAPDDWDFNGGEAAPVIVPGFPPAEGPADYQLQVRRTLDWTPLLDGVDYSHNPEADNNPEGVQSEFLPPAVWIGMANPIPGYLSGLTFPPKIYTLAEELGIGVSAAEHDWGVQLSGSPAHVLALNHWDGAKATDSPPIYDYEDMICTIAIESDQRLELLVGLPDGKPENGILDVDVKHAEYWILAPNTCVGVNPEGQLQKSGQQARLLRDDTAQLQAVAVAAVSRYLTGRARAEIQCEGIKPWPLLLGQILTVVDSGNLQQMAAPISEVAWSVPDGEDENVPQTTISAGYAI